MCPHCPCLPIPLPASACSDIWLITKHRDLVDALRDQRFSKASKKAAPLWAW